ncbi:hypothetical protein J4Q44_G00292740 [Coregonus suidteri]|uniref:Uncharacterized protein n=1 Tax=Coregonus suidteri TaxID=861788 RepID=A0AAN8QJH9_9TELE
MILLRYQLQSSESDVGYLRDVENSGHDAAVHNNKDGGYFTLGDCNRKSCLWSGNAEQPPDLNHSTLGGEEARRFYQSLIEHIGGWRGESSNTHSLVGIRGGERNHTGREGASERRGRAGEHVQASRQQVSTTSTTTELEGLRLLRCAQEGDLSGVRGLLSRGVDVNFQVAGGLWTGLMCAAAAGQRGVVRLLLQQGAAWVGVVDTQGRDARELARRAGHSGVLEELTATGLHMTT